MCGTTNLVDYNGRVWIVPQALGPIELRDPAQRARAGIVAHASLEAARAAVQIMPGVQNNPHLRLLDLNPRFIRYEEKLDTWIEVDRQPMAGELVDSVPTHQVTGMRAYWQWVDTIVEAQGVEFLCPKCFAANGGNVGTHVVVCWSRSRGVPDKAEPGPGRWRLVGTCFGDLSLMEEPGQSRSVALRGGCAWHGYVTDGWTS